MIRMNEGTPGNIEGGELTHITGNLYLLRAKEKSVKIENKGERIENLSGFRRLLSVCTWWSFYMDASVYHCYERA